MKPSQALKLESIRPQPSTFLTLGEAVWSRDLIMITIIHLGNISVQLSSDAIAFPSYHGVPTISDGNGIGRSDLISPRNGGGVA